MEMSALTYNFFAKQVPLQKVCLNIAARMMQCAAKYNNPANKAQEKQRSSIEDEI
jgi:hypothetical protein